MNRPTQPDMNDPVWTDTPLSIQQWMDEADAYINAIEQERDEAVELLRRAYHMIHARQISLMLDGFASESETNWLDDYESVTKETT